MNPTYTIQAYVPGLSWITFSVTRDAAAADHLEKQAIHANGQYPGVAPRRTRILIDGAIPEPRPVFSLSTPFYD